MSTATPGVYISNVYARGSRVHTFVWATRDATTRANCLARSSVIFGVERNLGSALILQTMASLLSACGFSRASRIRKTYVFFLPHAYARNETCKSKIFLREEIFKRDLAIYGNFENFKSNDLETDCEIVFVSIGGNCMDIDSRREVERNVNVYFLVIESTIISDPCALCSLSDQRDKIFLS